MKILFSPCHYVYDEIRSGSEISWAFNIAHKVASIYTDSLIVTGAISLLNDKKYKILDLHHTMPDIGVGIFSAILFNLKYNIKTFYLLRKEHFDILHHVLPFRIGNTFNLNIINKSFGRNKNIKTVIGPIQDSFQVVDTDLDTSYISKKLLAIFFILPNKLLSYLSKLTLINADVIIVIDETTKKSLLNLGISSEKIQIITPGIDVSKFKYVPVDVRTNKDIELLVVSYLLKRKAVDKVIEAFKFVVATNTNIKLRIVGNGPQMEKLIKLTNSLNLNTHITFEGRISNSEISDYYTKANIFLSMSREETWGQMYLEAMASGIPVIASLNRGSSMIIKNAQNGILVPREDTVEMCRQILHLVSNNDLQNKLSLNARKMVLENYDWDNVIIPKYIAVYKSLIVT